MAKLNYDLKSTDCKGFFDSILRELHILFLLKKFNRSSILYLYILNIYAYI